MTISETSIHIPVTRGRKALATFIGIALTTVIVAPISLSSTDLVKWATDIHGLGMSPALGWIVFVALDMAAATCVGMVTYSAWRGESAQTFHMLTWLFATGSAWANYRHGIVLRDMGKARDAWWFFPAMSLAGPLLLDVVLARVKRWIREQAQTQMVAKPKFGSRWIPGVAFRETLQAWATAKRENIARPDYAIAHVREVKALKGMSEADAIQYANTRDTDVHVLRTWLMARGVTVSQSAINETLGNSSFNGSKTDYEPDPVSTEIAIPESNAIVPANVYPNKRAAIRDALSTLDSDTSVANVMVWLESRGVTVDRREIYAVKKQMQEKSRDLLHVVENGS